VQVNFFQHSKPDNRTFLKIVRSLLKTQMFKTNAHLRGFFGVYNFSVLLDDRFSGFPTPSKGTDNFFFKRKRRFLQTQSLEL